MDKIDQLWKQASNQKPLQLEDFQEDEMNLLPSKMDGNYLTEILEFLPPYTEAEWEEAPLTQTAPMDPTLLLPLIYQNKMPDEDGYDVDVETLYGKPIGDDFQALGITPNRSPSKYKPLPPNIQAGLGSNAANSEIVEITRFIANVIPLLVYKEAVYQYVGTHWQLLSTHRLHVALRQCCSESDIDFALTPSAYKNIVWLLKSNPNLQRIEPFPHHSHLLNFTDGTLNLDTMEFYPHTPEDYLLTCLDFEYADISYASGETFEQFIACAGQGDRLIRRQVLQMLIMALTGLQCKTFFAIIGPSGTGKTQLGRLIASLLGEDRVKNIRGMRDFADKFALANIQDKSAILCMDLDDTILPQAAVGMLKQLVGDDAICAEEKYKNSSTVYHKPIFICAGNHPIRLNNLAEEEALLKRMVIIPFMGTPAEEARIPQLFEALTEERAYIVGQAILEYSRLMADGCQPIRAEVPDEYQAKDSRIGYDSVASFLKHCCLLKVDAAITSEALYQHYCAYCEGEVTPLDKLEFSRLFKSLILAEQLPVQHVKRVASGNRGYQGLTVRVDM